MKMKGVLATIVMAVLCISGNLFAYSGGDGSPENPYQISTVSDCQDLMAEAGDWYNSFILINDIDLADENITPVGRNWARFYGVFDGNGHIISNAIVNEPGSDNIGLFGYVGSGGQIHNLGVENVNVIGSVYVGGLVGYNDDGTITAKAISS